MMAAAARCSVSRSAARASGAAVGSSPPWSPLVQHTSQPLAPSSIQRAAVPAGPKSASSGWATMTMNRAGRQAWCSRGAASVIEPRTTSPEVRRSVARGQHRQYPSGRGFARIPPRAKLRATLASRGVGRLELVEHREHVGGMTLGLHLRPDARDATLRIDQERPPRRAPVGLAVVLLLDPRAVFLGDGVVDVGEQGERQVELLAEGALGCAPLRADTPHVRAALMDGRVAVAELARLDSAAGRVVLGVEVEDRPAATLVGQPVDPSGLVRE